MSLSKILQIQGLQKNYIFLNNTDLGVNIQY